MFPLFDNSSLWSDHCYISYSCYCTGREHLQRSEEPMGEGKASRSWNKEHVPSQSLPWPQTSSMHASAALRTHLFPTGAPDHAVQIFRGSWLCAMCPSAQQVESAGVTFPGRCRVVAWTWKKAAAGRPGPVSAPYGSLIAPSQGYARSSSSRAASGGGTVCCLVRRPGRNVSGMWNV
jgi:hypothetical protein